MASSTVGVLGVLIMLWTRRFNRADIMSYAVTRQAELIDGSEFQEAGIGRSVRCMASDAAFGLDRSVLIRERTLFVHVAFDTCGITARRQPGLLQLKTAVRIMAIAATHRTFQNFMMERRRERWFDFGVATGAELRIVLLQHPDRREARLFSV